MKNAYIILVEEPEGKRPLGRRSVNGKIILNCILKETARKGVNWIHLVHDYVSDETLLQGVRWVT
jgi:hypothetical protein